MPLPSKKLKPHTQKELVDYMEDCYKRISMSKIRSRFEEIDRSIQMETKEAKEHADERADYRQLTELGVIQPYVNSVKGFLVDLYLQHQPIFKPASTSAALLPAVKQMEALISDQAEQYKWSRHLALAFTDLPKYNFCAVEVSWDVNEITVPSTDRANREDGKSVLKTTERQGNAITRADPYNVFYDDLVPISEVHERGEFVGKIESIGMITVVQRLKALGRGGGQVMNADNIFKSSVNPNRHFVPSIIPGGDSSPRGYAKHFAGAGSYVTNSGKRPYSRKDLDNTYEWVTLYARIIPSMFGIAVAKPNEVQVWKLQYCNSMLVAAQPMDEVHGYFSLLLAQITEEGLNEQSKTLVETVTPIQNLTNRMYSNRLSALARNVGGRYAYVEGAVSRADLTNPDPRMPIAVRPNSFSKNIRDLLVDIPFTDSTGPSFINEIEYLSQRGERLMRLNRAQQGQFQKGNKTLGEFKEIMGNANADLRVMALLVENSLISNIKMMLRNNIFQFQPPEDIVNADGTRTTINPSELRDASLKFKLADGLIVKEDLVDVGVLREFMQFASTNQEMNAKYDVPALMAFIYTTQGNVDLNQFLRPPAEQQPTPPAGAPANGA